MATNIVLEPGYRQAVVVTNPASPVSGDPIRFGKTTGIALQDEGAGGAGDTETVVDLGPMVVEVVVDDNESSGIAVGDPVYYHDTGTGTGPVHLNNSATAADAFFGYAMEVVSANATTLIKVLHVPVGHTTTNASTVSTGQIDDNAITAAKIADGVVGTAEIDAILSGAADGLGMMRAARFTFDPSANSGQRTVAAHGLGVTLPDNALVLYGIMEILTTFADGASDNATIALSVEGANDLVTATAISSGTFWDAVLSKAVVPDALRLAGIATAIKLSAAREITATVAVHALTAGKLVGWLFYVVGA